MTAFFDVALPVFGIILVGFGVGKIGLLGDDGVNALNRYVYYIAFPALFLVAIGSFPASTGLNLPFVVSVLGVQVVLFFAAAALASVWFPKPLGGLSLHGLTAVFSNSAYMGIPLVLLAFGESAAIPAIVATVLNAVGLLVLASCMIQLGQRNARKGTGQMIDLLKDAASNPLLIAAIGGIIVSAMGVSLPKAGRTLLKLLGDTAGPCALIAMGMFLARISFARGRRTVAEIGWLSFLKLVIHPLATWFVATQIFALDGVWAATAVIMASLPTGALTFVLAQRNQVFVEQTASVILTTTIASTITTTTVLSLYGM